MNGKYVFSEESSSFDTPAMLRQLKCSPNASEWDAFFIKYSPMIFALSRRAGLSVADSDDIVQESMTEIVRRILNFSNDAAGDRLTAWVVQIARSKITDYFRKRDIANRLDTRASDWVNEPDPKEGLRQELLTAALTGVGRRVSPESMQIFLKVAVEGVKAEVVARAYSKSTNAVYVLKRKVNALLRYEVERLSLSFV